MKKILFLDGSLNNSEISYTTATMNYLETLFDKNEYSVERVNLNESKFADYSLSAKTSGDFWTNVESDKWINKLKETDLLVISMSMVNYGPTAVVKNFMDGVAVANKTFSYKYSTTQDAVGFLTNLNVLVVASQGANFGTYPWGDHIKWLKGTFKFLGAKTTQSFDILGTKVSEISKQTASEFVESKKSELNELISEIKSSL
ncbi:azoreductase [Mycoplasmopsis canis UFG4]|uniref:Azoreductase n=2 Tax=Mycoplasmopsis canis TaxID=29555 RepID=I1A5W0_9BACT|nr:FMN-dependent NADH-azoreductase [Mycoplasmopsis canis]AMD81055.1 FMN-dependent NADH-azoreductase [Mycoplasmopsis canis PG 14]EIE39886.1 azoreductase [Mycoplasmopsis canis PG 14]EIE41668.1 azoreductase [Mycoplasmopsis canis UFG1]EIE41881.1 azoreductase [Mycoplasmopsis canis UFG4]WQQ12353.1 FMN-dependent NADH-azoreductase [Mycoplasmopsis canis]